jgi:hypothetical protein
MSDNPRTITPNDVLASSFYGGAEPPSAPTRPEFEHPNDAPAGALYDKKRLHPAVAQGLANHHDQLAGTLNLDRAERETLVTQIADAVTGAGIGIYDYKLLPTLLASVVAARVAEAKDAEFDDTADRDRFEEAVRELRGIYGDDEAEDLLRRANRFLDKNPALADVIKLARAGNDPNVVRALVEHVRAENLGR